MKLCLEGVWGDAGPVGALQVFREITAMVIHPGAFPAQDLQSEDPPGDVFQDASSSVLFNSAPPHPQLQRSIIDRPLFFSRLLNDFSSMLDTPDLHP